MASPTFAELATQLADAVEINEDLKTEATNLASNIDAAQQNLEGDRVPTRTAAMQNIRSQYSNNLRQSAHISSVLIDMIAHIVGSPQTDPAAMMASVQLSGQGDLFQYFIDNSESVNSRAITFGTVTAGGSNVGTGTVYRLNTDRNSQDIEATAMTTKQILCLSDSASNETLVGEESFEIRHTTQDTDELDWTNHGDVSTLTTKGPENGLLLNGSFQDIGGVTADTAFVSGDTIPSWTIDSGTITDFQFSTQSAELFAPSPTERDQAQSYSLRIDGNFKISQKIRVNGNSIDPNTPYFLLIHYNREEGAGDGTLTIRMGTNSANVVLAAQTGFNVLILTMDQNLWYDNFKEDDLNIEVELASNTTGYINIDYCIFDVMDEFDGLHYAAVGGATPFQKSDVFTFADALSGSEGINQYWMHRLFRRHLPHNNAGAETVADP